MPCTSERSPLVEVIVTSVQTLISVLIGAYTVSKLAAQVHDFALKVPVEDCCPQRHTISAFVGIVGVKPVVISIYPTSFCIAAGGHTLKVMGAFSFIRDTSGN